MAACVRIVLTGFGVRWTEEQIRTIHVLDPVEGPQPQRSGREAFALAWQMAGREALVVEAPPHRVLPHNNVLLRPS